jgi:hypothetical protein
MTMAKPKVAIVRVPRFIKAKAAVRRGATAAARFAADEKHTLAAALAAGALGWAEKSKTELPRIKALGTAATYGLAAWALGKFTKSRVARHVATGLLSVAAYQFAKGGGDAMTGDDDDDVSGDLD